MAKLAGIAVSVTVAALVLSGQALADIDFCSSPGDCTTTSKGKIYNKAEVVVKKVTIHQEAKHGCASVEKTHTGDMDINTDFSVTLNGGCSYNVEFQPTSGCDGDTSTKITLSDNQVGKTTVELKGICGSLKTGDD